MLEFIELPCSSKPRAIMVWLHGLGADGHDLEPVAEMLGIPGLRHVFPHAPVRPVSINGGMAMRAWYDIAAPDLQHGEDSEGMRLSAKQVAALIAKLRNDEDVPVVLAGFSQGAVIALAVAALEACSMAGIVAMSGYLPKFLEAHLSGLLEKPVLMMHGEQDGVVPYALGLKSGELLKGKGVILAWHAYPMPHSICQQEMDDLASWLLALPCLSPDT